MADELENLLINLEVDNAPLISALRGADRSIDRFEKNTDKAFRSVSRAGDALSNSLVRSLGGIAAGFGAVRIAASAFEAINAAGEINDLSRNAALSTEAFQELAFAVRSAGGSTEEFGKASVKFAANMAKLRVGQGQLNELLENHLPVVRAQLAASASQEEAYDILAETVRRLATEEERTMLAQAAFGKSGADLVEVLVKGSAGLKEMADKARELGAIQDGDLLDSAEQLKKEYDELSVSVESFWQRGVIGVANYAKALKDNAINVPGIIHNTLFGKPGLGTPAGASGAPGASADPSRLGMFSSPGIGGATIPTPGAGSLSFSQPDPWAASVIPVSMEEQLREQADAWRELNEAANSTLDDLIDNRTETAATKMDALKAAVKGGEIGWREYQSGVKAVEQQQEESNDAMLDSVTTFLDAAFGESKTAAIASAIINTYQGITKALASLPPPASYAAAAATAAMGFAQVPSIRSASRSGGGGGGSVAGSAAAPAAAASPAAMQSNQTLTVQGLNPTALFSGRNMRELAEAIIKFQKNGGRVTV